MVFDEKWNGMIEEAGGMIEVFDYAINPTEYYEAGAYVSLTAFKEMQKFSEELEGRAKDQRVSLHWETIQFYLHPT